MLVIKFDYYSDITLRKDNSRVLSVIDRPKIPIKIRLSGKQSNTPILCLIDSGADMNLFPAHMGESIGIDITKYPQSGTRGIGNAPPIVTYKVPNIDLLIGYKAAPDYLIKADVFFTPNQQIPLLGREGFFKFFKMVSFINNEHIELHF
ncbi:hypothetical protein CO007_04050 [Candidatus Roizmanbacteria bacterium CG_4_8_14_3_um_filter_36_10]|uniref:Peptidase A2 domain-containing protein n=2 Tax=Candidatus Roizmaniibacteriota TaxID=1752723 RepID=A0A2M7BR06_9BACT|nr:MAG: hypothetical protein COS52_05515 [Candidatus Roizmanbacteria bacterium CG03_land_8_20_14_0_80_39_12]PJC81563.1 MAG: hypothetical protein CO007_04050 [Candidatus Roizmanbacteria bacterium CG_4_8_14_3_um_filter_36_10]